MDLAGLADLLTPAVLFLIFLAILVCCRSRRDEHTVKGKMIGGKNQDRDKKPSDLSDKQLRDLQENLERYIDIKFSRFEKEIRGLIERMTPKPPTGKFEPGRTSGEGAARAAPGLAVDEVEVEPDPMQSYTVRACVEIYNTAINNPAEEGHFMKKYNPMLIDVPNAMQRLRNSDLEPIFVSADKGDFFLIELSDEGSTSFAVFPRLGLTISRSNYESGAISQVFKCPGFNPQFIFKITAVVKPAYFLRGRSNRWDIMTQGKLSILSDEYEEG